MSLNVGGLDKNIRIVLGIILIAVGFFFVHGTLGTIIGVVGFVPLLTGLFNFCPVYSLFKFSTKKE